MRPRRTLRRMGAAVRSDRRYPASLTKRIAMVFLPYAPTSHHNTYRGLAGETYLLQVKIEPGGDVRWSAWIETLQGFAAWGYSKEEALDAGKETAQAYLEVLVEKGRRIPEKDSQIFPKPPSPSASSPHVDADEQLSTMHICHSIPRQPIRECSQ